MNGRRGTALALAAVALFGWLALRSPRAPSAPAVARGPDPGSSPAREEEDGRQGVEQRVRLASGPQARLSASWASYPGTSPIELELALSDAGGGALGGRLDLEATILDATGRHQPLTGSFVERIGRPGHYQLTQAIPLDWPRVSVVLPFRERPDLADPGETQVVQLQVQHEGPASLGRRVVGRFVDGGFQVQVPVESSRTGRGALRALLVTGEGRTVGEASAAGPIGDDAGPLSLLYPIERPAQPQAFYLQDLTLLVDGAASDFRSEPISIRLF